MMRINHDMMEPVIISYLDRIDRDLYFWNITLATVSDTLPVIKPDDIVLFLEIWHGPVMIYKPGFVVKIQNCYCMSSSTWKVCSYFCFGQKLVCRRLKIPFPSFSPNPGLMSAKQIHNSPEVGNVEKERIYISNFIHQIFKIKQRNVKSTISWKICWKMKKRNWIFLFLLLVLVRDRCADIESVWIPEKQFSHPLVFSTPATKCHLLQTILLGAAASLFFVAFSTNKYLTLQSRVW